MRLPILLTAALLLVAACDQQAAPGAPDAAAPAAEAAPEPMMPADAPPQEEAVAPVEASSTACRLVERCIAVSPATRPPCNVANPCQMIQDEIDRSCAMYGPGETKPAECAA